MMLNDSYGRKHTYLRIGVTDRCNLRCRYCMPEEGIDFLERKDLLTYEEIIKIAGLFEQMGVQKVRLTGGEPFSRKNIMYLIKNLQNIFRELYITTNATLLAPYIEELSQMNINGLNISLDTLDRNRFEMITRRDSFLSVMDNIEKCISNNIDIKINMVVMKGINDHELTDFIDFGQKNNIPVRFIEAMPFNASDGNKNQFLSEQDILLKLVNQYDSITKMNETSSSSSNKYLLENDYSFGIIPAYTRSLCSSCNRIRMTPKGELLTCLYSTKGISLRDALRSELHDEKAMKELIQQAIFSKKRTGKEEQNSAEVLQSMTTIGG